MILGSRLPPRVVAQSFSGFFGRLERRINRLHHLSDHSTTRTDCIRPPIKAIQNVVDHLLTEAGVCHESGSLSRLRVSIENSLTAQLNRPVRTSAHHIHNDNKGSPAI